MTVLHLAAASNDIHLLDFLFTHLGEDQAINKVNIKNSEGWTPMHLACFFSNMDTVNLLLEYGGDLLEPNATGMSSLMETVRCDHKDLLSCIYKQYGKTK